MSQGNVVEKSLTSLKTISAQNSSTQQRPTSHWIPCSRPRDPSLVSPGLVVWLVAILEYGILGSLYFCFGEGGGIAPMSCNGWHSQCTTAIKWDYISELASSSPLYTEAGWVKSRSPISAHSETKMASCSFLDPQEVWEQAGHRWPASRDTALCLLGRGNTTSLVLMLPYVTGPENYSTVDSAS